MPPQIPQPNSTIPNPTQEHILLGIWNAHLFFRGQLSLKTIIIIVIIIATLSGSPTITALAERLLKGGF